MLSSSLDSKLFWWGGGGGGGSISYIRRACQSRIELVQDFSECFQRRVH